MPFLQIHNAIESAQCRLAAAMLPAILVACAAVTFLANLVILTIEAGQAARRDCRILLGKPTPVAHTIASPATIALSCRECIAALQARCLAADRAGGCLIPLK